MEDGRDKIDITNLTGFSIDKILISKILSSLIEEETGKNVGVSVVLVGGKKIKELNKVYREKDYVTDVLSFFYDEDDLIGEIFVCPSKIKKDFKEDFTKELFRVIIHGALHLSGYHHGNEKEETVMNRKTELYLREV